jgi:hypothetical protein
VSARTAGRLAWSLFGLTVLSFAGALVMVFTGAGIGSGLGIVLAIGVFIFAFEGVGALVASRQPGNPLGWIMCLAGLAYALMSFADRYAQPYLDDPADGLPGSVTALWAQNWGWIAAVGPTATFLLLLFPNGRLPSPRWRPVAWLAAAGLAAAVPGLAFSAGKLEGYDVENPVGVPGASVVAGFAMAVLFAAVIGSIASLFVRWRHAHTRERLQLKWLSYAGGIVGLGMLSIPVLGAVGNPSDDLTNSIVSVTLAAVPVSIGIAILRHGLYEIDVVINRTLVYLALTATLAGAYLGSVLLLQLVLSPSSDLAVAGSTLAVAALFRPLRHRIQALVDRRFYRRRYDAARTLERFGGRLRDEVDLDSLGGELRGVVLETMQPAHVSLWLREASR